EIATSMTEAYVVGDTLGSATDMGTLGTATQGQSIVVSSAIEPLPYDLQWPGAITEIGHRELPSTLAGEAHLGAISADKQYGTAIIYYNFKNIYGQLPNGSPAVNLITPEQKQRAREIFELYGAYLGVTFIEDTRTGSNAMGLTIATGDLRVISETIPTGPGGVAGLAGGGLAIMDQAETWQDGYGQNWFGTAMHEIGHLLGFAHTYDMPIGTIMGSSGGGEYYDASVEPLFPGNVDIIHGLHVYRPDSIDVDVYRFEIQTSGTFSAETVAERLESLSLLDSVVTLHDAQGRIIARNDDYYSEDSYLEVELEPGVYYVTVASTGNTEYNLDVAGSGLGGTTQGNYDLRMTFVPSVVATNRHLVDADTLHDGTPAPTLFDGDADGVPGGVHDFWFNVQTIEKTLFVDKTSDGVGQLGSLDNPYREIDDALAAAKPGDIVRIVGNRDRTFDAQMTYEVSTKPAGTAVGDVTGDGIADIIVTNENDGSISLLRGIGDGTYWTPITYLVGSRPGAVTLADLDNDGDLDIVAVNQGNNTLSLLINNGNGIFNQQITRFTGSQPTDVELADLNGDGVVDIVVTNRGSNDVSVLLSDPNVMYRDQVRYALGAGAAPAGVALADLNNDGRIDIVTANEGADTVAVLINRENGVFNTPVSFAAGDGPSAVAIADLDGDGNRDVVVANRNDNDISVLMGLGTGSLAAQVRYATGTQPGSLGVADLDGDGSPDVVAANYADDTVSVLFGLGNGAFETQVVYGVGDQPTGLTLADIDGDGRRDIITANQGDDEISVLRARRDKAYLVGRTKTNQVLADGASLNVPMGVTVMVDAGAVFKVSRANINVGSASLNVNQSEGALQVLGTPLQNVYFTSYYDRSLGSWSDQSVLNPTVNPGDWGGLVFRNNLDYQASDRKVLETEGIFLNYVNNAEIRYGGGLVSVNGVSETYNPIHMVESRPTLTFNTIVRSADAAMSADPNSFADTKFQGEDFTADYDRVGPDIHGNLIVDNSINGLFVRIRTDAGTVLDRLNVSARWDDTDIVHVVQENLLIAGTPGGPGSNGQTLTARYDARLAIDPGIIVKLGYNRIETQIGVQLLAEGTAALPIIFTSKYDDTYGMGGTFDTDNGNRDPNERQAAPGDWGGLYFGPVSSGSIDHAVITYAGGETRIPGGFAKFNPVEIHQANVRLANSTLAWNTGATTSDRAGRPAASASVIFVRGAQPIVVDNVIRDNTVPAMSINANALKYEQVADWGRSTGYLDAFAEYLDNHGPLVRGNALANNGVNGMVVRGEVLSIDSVWDDTEIVHVLYDEIVIPNFHTYGGLRLQSAANQSLVVKLLGENAGFTALGTPQEIEDRIGGTLQIVGAAGYPVVLTSLHDDSVGAGRDPWGNPQNDTDNAVNSALAGDWRSVKLERYVNDRNVAVVIEREAAHAGGNTNDTPHSAQSLGSLAPNMKSGDENLRLGFDVHGFIAGDDSNDADVYSFTGRAGTEVWIDIDRTTMGLDSIVELIDADGNVLASSRSSTAEENGLIAPEGLGRTLNRDAWSGTGDMYTTNVHDAGMRLVLPGVTGSLSLYYVRVRSADNTADGKGDSSGAYQLQVRIREDQEIAGSTVQYSSIRYATSGIELLGLPTSSPLVTDTAEIEGTMQTTEGVRASAPVRVDGNFNDFTVTATTPGVAFNNVWIVFVNGGQTGNVAEVIYNPGFDNGGTIIRVLFILGDPDATTAATVVAAINAEGTFTAELTANDGGANNGSGLIRPLNTQLGLTSGGINPTSGITDNNTFETAEYLGNLLETNYGAIKVSGYLTNTVNSITGETQYDIDWYSFSLAPTGTQNISGVAQPNIWNVIFDIDYADGMGRPDTIFYVFDSSGTLMYISHNSNVLDDQADPLGVTGMQDLTRGSAGTNDPYLGPIALKDGDSSGPNGSTYYVAVASIAMLPWAAYGSYVETGVPIQPLLRFEPVNSVTRIADDTVGDLDGDGIGDSNGGALAGSPQYVLFPDPTFDELSIHVNDFQLSDVVMYVCIGSDVYTFNPFTGEYHYDLTAGTSRPHSPDGNAVLAGAIGGMSYNDIVMRNDGKLYTMTLNAAGTGGNYRQISTGDGSISYDNDASVGVYILDDSDPTKPNAIRIDPDNPGVTFEAMINVVEGGTRYMYAIGSGGDPAVQWLFKFDQDGNSVSPGGSQAALPTSILPWRVLQNAQGFFTGLDFVDGRLYGVTDAGWLYPIDGYSNTPRDAKVVDKEGETEIPPQWTATNWLIDFSLAEAYDLNTAFELPLIEFSGLSVGPPNVEGGSYAMTLFATDNAGAIYAFDAEGVPSPVFLDGLATITLGITNPMTGAVNPIAGATGVAFSTLDYNLWHITQNRRTDEGHTITVAPDESRQPMQEGSQDSGYGNYSYWFGLERSGTFEHPGARDYLDENPGVISTYDLPGGAKGVLTTSTFSLAGYQAQDLPFLYFDYFLETDGGTESNIVTDSARVYISNDGVTWNLLVTNIDTPNDVMLDSDDNPNTPPVYMADGSGLWLQAKVNLTSYVGLDNLRLKFEFTTAGSTNVNSNPGENLYTGATLVAVSGNELVDGDTFTLLSDMTMVGEPQVFEFDMGYSLLLPASAGRAIRDGETLTITDDLGRTVTFEFDKDGQVADGNTPIQISDVDSTSVVAQAISIAFNTFYEGNVSVVAGDRVFLCSLDKNLAGIPTLPITWYGAMDVSQGLLSAIEIEGNAPGMVNDPEIPGVLVPVDGSMRAEGVAYQIGRAVDAFYAEFYGGEDTGTLANPNLFTSVKVDQSLIHLLKHGVGDPGKLNYGDGLPGETPGASSAGANGTQFYFNTQAQDNAYEGWYIDNVVIGFIERGEMISHAAPDTSFGQVDPSEISGYITEGHYQLDIRVSTEYSYWNTMFNITANTRSFDTNDRHADDITIIASPSEDLVHLAKFTVSDGVNTQTFRFVNPTLPFSPEEGVINIFFSAGRRADQIAQSITSAINSATNLNVTASNVAFSSRVGSDRVVLSGAALVTGIEYTVYDQLGEYPTDIVALDVDEDEVIDLMVTTNEYKGTISVLPGPTVYEVGSRPSALEMGDVNGDGTYDIVVANAGDGTVSVLLGNVDGSYKSQVVFGVGVEPSDVTLFDLDGDGNLDIVTSNLDDNTVSILYGNGDGTFQTAVTLAVGDAPASVALGDLDGDGFGDIVVANSLDYTVSVLMNLGGAGFAAPVEYRVGRLPVDVKLGDMDNNETLDILTANRADGTVSVLLGNGDGTFGEKADYAAGTEPVALTVDYFNQDDNLDVVVANYSTGSVRVLRGTGFDENTLIPANSYPVGAGPNGVVLGDWDADGAPDIITADYFSHRATVLLSMFGYEMSATYATGQPLYRKLKGDTNNEQVQGQIVINGNEILQSAEYGIRYDAGERDGYPHPGSVAPLVKVNEQKLVPGVTIQNNLIVQSGVAGILFSGDPNNQGAQAATPFGKIINNTVYGNGVDAIINLLEPGDVVMPPNDDESSSLLDIGFELNFYGNTYTQMYVNNNGNITFDYPLYDFTPEGFPQDMPIIAPFWGDVDTTAGGEVRVAYGTSARGNAVVQIDWIDVGYFASNVDKLNTFTLYIEDDPLGDIVVFVYHNMQWTTGDIDSDEWGSGFGGAGAQVGFDAGDYENFISVMRPKSAADLADLMDPGTYVWRLSGEAGIPVEASSDTGILVINNASPTILNNIVANTDVGILIDGTSRTAVLGANVYQRNGLNAVGAVESATAVILGPNDPLFVDAASGNFYLASGSKAIDSAVNSLEERVAMAEVRDPLGIARSPLLAPDYDLYGQQRVDDPSAQPPSGSGSNVFKDRGAIDRVDFDRPTAMIVDPLDNDPAGIDLNSALDQVFVIGQPTPVISIQLNDGLFGAGIFDYSVKSSKVHVYVSGREEPLVAGVDYFFRYDATHDIISLIAAAGLWEHGKAYTIVLDNGADGIMDVAGNPLQANQLDGSATYVVALTHVDFGDAPDPIYPTKLENDGARHLLIGDYYLGYGVTGEADANLALDRHGNPINDATGDAMDDGVVFMTSLLMDSVVTLQVRASRAGYLNAWIDLNGDGDFDDAGEHVIGQTLVRGVNNVSFVLPEGDFIGDTFARFRFTSTSTGPSVGPTGLAMNGEVEDYKVTIVDVLRDYGDAPAPYPTLFADNGARHELGGGLFLGGRVDDELDGQPDSDAAGDDKNGSIDNSGPEPVVLDDEDGVVFADWLIPGQLASVTVTASMSGGYLNAWIDFDGDGAWSADEKIADGKPLAAGVNTVVFTVPSTAEGTIVGHTFARFRLSSEISLEPTGAASDGEVEDYKVIVTAEPRDYGDAPRSYMTVEKSEAAFAQLILPGHDNDMLITAVTPGAEMNDVKVNIVNDRAVGDIAFVSYNATTKILQIDVDPLRTTSAAVVAAINTQQAAWFKAELSDLVDQGNDGTGFIGSIGTVGITAHGQDGSGDDAAYHVLWPAPGEGARRLHLGKLVDAELDGQPDDEALGDDANDLDDEDGITLPEQFMAGQQTNITVEVQMGDAAVAYLSAWIDLNIDGVFTADEQVLFDVSVVDGIQAIPVTIPMNASAGATFARFRLSTRQDLSFGGGAPDGEVEDYQVVLARGTASIDGWVFEDRNNNGRFDANERGISGVTVFIDVNENGIL
ncbi:MAG: hypothetical protein GX621_18135, partial [Pirellulaceae bacterium]|nr:hypothetical protein [Pirellulaceae bacterium]